MPHATRCRICQGSRLTPFLDLGSHPPSDSFLRADQLSLDEPHYPLVLLFCEDCHLVQLSYVVDPREMFNEHYPYVSGTTKSLTAHFQSTAWAIRERYKVPRGSLVVDIGSNDGTLLLPFKKLGMRVLGVDPSSSIAAGAVERGIPTIPDFFGERVAREIVANHGHAKIVTACGVFFHIDDMADVCRGIKALLDNDGLLHIQAIYLGSMLDQGAFDSVYHEHVSYYTLGPLRRLLADHELEVFDVGWSPIHNGSLTVCAGHPGMRPVDEMVSRTLAQESKRGWDTLSPYRAFAAQVEIVRYRLLEILHHLKHSGKRIAAYGAPAKGNTLLNYCGIGTDLVESAWEVNPLKIGMFTPGSHIPVVDEAEAMKDPPDYLLLLPWNFRDELLVKLQPFRDAGGKVIIPLPSPVIV